MPLGTKILVIGGSGRLGLALRRRLPVAGFAVEAPPHESLDLVRHGDLERRIAAGGPGAVVLAAAFNDVDGAERAEAQEALEALNVTGPGRVATACRNLGLPLIHLSTDYVFDGRADRPYLETDPTGPLQRYGRSKLAGERAVLDGWAEAWVLRTSTLYGPTPPGRTHYVDQVLARLKRNERVAVVRTPVASPTLTLDLADAIAAVLQRRPAAGLFHVVNGGACSRLDLAREIARRSGYDPACVAERAERPGGAVRPARCALDGARFHRETGHRLRSWQDALTDWLREERA